MDIEKGEEFSQWIRKKRLKFTRSALRNTVEDMIKNPDIYLWAMAVKLCQDAGDELEIVEDTALSMQGKEVRGNIGKDSYYDITSMVIPGKNTITYYHYTGGPGVGVKVRIH